MRHRLSCLLFLLISICAGCANITSPSGGKKDTRPPKLIYVDPEDSMVDTRVSKIVLRFDEYINLVDVNKEVTLSPMLQIDPQVSGNYKHVIIKIPDTLLEENTTYRLSLGNAIRDVHENNPFSGYTYTFSTGPYFDSLTLHGEYLNAATGLADVEGVIIGLYSASDNDSAVVRHRPKYVVKGESGMFTFKGLPKRPFRIYAMKDANGNMTYDGAGEMIAFTENTVMPGDTGVIKLRLFEEAVDTAKISGDLKRKGGGKPMLKNPDALTYSVNVDTSNKENRTFDINQPVIITFSQPTQVNTAKIMLSYDSAGEVVSPVVSFDTLGLHDTARGALRVVKARTNWRENTVYKLGLAKGFARDTSGSDVLPSRYLFRTKEDEDYGKINIHLLPKYLDQSQQYVLKVMVESDTVYQKPVTDTMVKLSKLKPGKYTFSIIVDKNRNGKWDTGDLLAHRQPEVVIPATRTVELKANWEHTVDFEEVKPNLRSSKDTR